MIRPFSRSLRRAVLVGTTMATLLVATLTASAATAWAAAAHGTPGHLHHPAADLQCSITSTSTVHPGEIYGVLQHLHGTTHGLTGTAACTGTVHGLPVTGPGRFGVETREYGDCGATQSTGRDDFVLRLPTTRGTKTVTGVYFDTSINTGSGFVVELSGDITGTTQVLSYIGECTAADPLTSITSLITGHVS